MKNTLYTATLLLAAIILSGCTDISRQAELTTQCSNAIYHWKTTFAPTPEELGFLSRHKISRLYIRMFDVAAERNQDFDRVDIVPIATTEFTDTKPSQIPGIEVVPTTYITIEALRLMRQREELYAELIVERLRAMANYNNCGVIREMQFDCDWTSSTHDIYFNLCRKAKAILEKDSIALSATIRLHQLSQEAPPVDRGVLMLYNTGNLKSKKTVNSILDIDDVKPYLKQGIKYSVPLDYAYPTYGWGVKFYYNKFVSIVSQPEKETPSMHTTIRIERPTVREVLQVKRLVEKTLGKSARSNIIYHLDSEQLNHYTDDEITKIFANN